MNRKCHLDNPRTYIISNLHVHTKTISHLRSVEGLGAISHARRLRASSSQVGLSQIHLRNPWVTAFWSFAFPGCGHLLQDRLLRGLILIVWEMLVNGNAKINLSIMYSLLGNFEMAKQVVNQRWFLLYTSMYVFSIWDSYRGTVDLNKQYILADREDAPLSSMTTGTLDTNFLDKRSPLFACVISILTPGLGHLYVNKVISGLFFIGWTICSIYFSHCLSAVHETMLGNFNQAKSILDMQWLMYLPSIYGFVIYDAYVSAVENNKLFKKAQSKFLRDNYQFSNFKMPFKEVERLEQ